MNKVDANVELSYDRLLALVEVVSITTPPLV